MPVQHSLFPVEEEPYCIWDWDIKARNIEFIQSIDSAFFEYSARAHVESLNDQDKQLAATAIRSIYHHALETFFALICATLQAPHCVVGWIQKYQPSQLRRMVSSISKGNANFLINLKIEHIDWGSISDMIIQFRSSDEKRNLETKKLFANAWRRLAHDFVDEHSVWEYNSIKHGFRTKPGGMRLEFGVEQTPGVPPPTEQMQVLGSSEFGNSFLRAQQIFRAKNDPHFRLATTAVAWNPEGCIYGIVLLAKSIHNVVSFLKFANGVDPATFQFVRFVDDDIFNKPWDESPNVSYFSLNYDITENSIQKFTRKQIREELNKILSRSQSAAR